MRRRCTPELMDDPRLDMVEYHSALRSLNRVNRWLRVDSRLYKATARRAAGGTFSVLDVGAGGGGYLQYVSGRPGSRYSTMRIGMDASIRAITAAQAWSDDQNHWVVGDARRIPLADSSVDVVTSSLLLHHLDAAGVIDLLRESARVCRVAVVLNDLARSWHSLVLTWAGTRVLSRSRVFHVDGPRSVHAAWTPNELHELARQSGLGSVIVRRQFPFRMTLVFQKRWDSRERACEKGFSHKRKRTGDER